MESWTAVAQMKGALREKGQLADFAEERMATEHIGLEEAFVGEVLRRGLQGVAVDYQG